MINIKKKTGLSCSNDGKCNKCADGFYNDPSNKKCISCSKIGDSSQTGISNCKFIYKL